MWVEVPKFTKRSEPTECLVITRPTGPYFVADFANFFTGCRVIIDTLPVTQVQQAMIRLWP